MMTVFAGIAEFERDLIRERAGAGREAAKKRGVGFGRTLKPYFRPETIGFPSSQRRQVSSGHCRDCPCPQCNHLPGLRSDNS